MIMITSDKFRKVFARAKNVDELVMAMEKVLPENDINTVNRIASFIAQCGHESGGWRVFSENLNYSSKALNIVFPKYFRRAGRDAAQYHRKPEKIANVVYANRMGNGTIESGDGWKYRGRGPIQLTGYDNYYDFSMEFGINVIDNPELVSDNEEIGLKSAIFFWNKNNLNRYADKDDIKTQTKRINGGLNGFDDRKELYEKLKKLL